VHELRARGSVGADELAELLGVTKQCVRKHLDVLEREGYVEHAAARGERGRPAHVFRLTPKAEELFPKRYDLLARSVLRQVGEVWGERGLNAVFCGCASEMVAEVCSAYIMRAGEVLELFATEGLRPEAVHRTRLRVGESAA